MILKENFYTLDGNLYKIIESNSSFECFLYIKNKGFIKEANPYDILLNGNKISKNQIAKYILKLI